TPEKTNSGAKEKTGGTTAVAGKPRILFVLPRKGFYYADFGPVKDRLEKQGAEVIVAAPFIEPVHATPDNPVDVTPNVTMREVRASDYDALIICGGPGVIDEFTGQGPGVPGINDLCRAMLAQDKHVAAICTGPSALANLGLLRDRNATWNVMAD